MCVCVCVYVCVCVCLERGDERMKSFIKLFGETFWFLSILLDEPSQVIVCRWLPTDDSFCGVLYTREFIFPVVSAFEIVLVALGWKNSSYICGGNFTVLPHFCRIMFALWWSMLVAETWWCISTRMSSRNAEPGTKNVCACALVLVSAFWWHLALDVLEFFCIGCCSLL